MIKILTYKVSEGNLRQNGGGLHQSFIEEAEKQLNDNIRNLEAKGYGVQDIKVNHFVTTRHNNGGCDEVWSQFTIIYEEDDEE